MPGTIVEISASLKHLLSILAGNFIKKMTTIEIENQIARNIRATQLMKTLIQILILLIPGWIFTLGQDNNLTEGFRNPPESARPRTWWHWTGGNVTLEGISLDLEWMNRVGIAGFQLADVSYGMGQQVDRKIFFGSEEWLSAVQHAASEAERLGLEMSMFSSAGWSLTGGPWVQPAQAMKKLVWSETHVSGPIQYKNKLPLPPSGNGPIRNLYYGRSGNGRVPDPTFYQDQIVLAFPTPEDEIVGLNIIPVISMEDGLVDGATLLDGDLNTNFKVAPNNDGSPVWLQYAFNKPFKAQALTLASRAGIPFGRLLVSNDGIKFRTLVSLPGIQNYRGGKVRTFSFPAVEASYFRLELTGAPLSPARFIEQPPPEQFDTLALAEAILHSGARMNRWEDKAGFYLMNDYSSSRSLPIPPSGSILHDAILDLTDKMDTDGNLDWKTPDGNWTILRLGYSLTGAKNRPAVAAGLGFEVDKLNEVHTRTYMEDYLRPIKKELGPLFGKSLQYILMDSWEAGTQNWTNDMIEEFTRRRSYDPRPYLPVLTGFIVEDAEVSERFLWDYRRTLADMFAENHYGAITKYLHEEGLKTYGEASGVSLEILEDALLCKKYVDIPMGEFWVNDLHPSSEYHVDIRGAASASHAYGKTLVAAEAFTGGNYESPLTLKRIADYWFTQGVNRLVFHTSAHQPNDDLPGNIMVGTHLHRNITWAEQAGPLMDYFSRISYILQQGLFVADLAYLLDEGAPSTMPFWGAGPQPEPPKGYDYDYVNTDILINRMSVDENGRIILPDGMSYAALVLPVSTNMTRSVLRKIHELVKEGATIIGPKVTASPSLEDYPEGDNEIRQLAEDLWADIDGITRTRNYYGKGTVVWGEPLENVLGRLGLTRDVEYGRELDAEFHWIHRNHDDMDIYFLSSQNPGDTDVEFRFRTTDRDVEFWYPDKGIIKSAPYTQEDDHTRVNISFPAYGSVFVVFRNTAPGTSRLLTVNSESELIHVEGPWELIFEKGLGAPENIQIPELLSWTDFPDEGVKYFSGSCIYVNTFKVPGSWLKPDTEIILDLGLVKDIASVTLNGNEIGLVWKPPYTINLSKHLKKGKNKLEISVTNQWSNRLLGDQQAAEEAKILDFNVRVMFDKPELKSSGLLGPVKVILRQNTK